MKNTLPLRLSAHTPMRAKPERVNPGELFFFPFKKDQGLPLEGEGHRGGMTSKTPLLYPLDGPSLTSHAQRRKKRAFTMFFIL
jgi:hypothetical protein